MMKQRQKNRQEASYKKYEKRSDSEEDETELFIRSKPPKREAPNVEKVVEEGDTLQSLAIRYRCTIEELKRLNNIHKENEIFARRIIRVPHHPISMALAEVHTSGTLSPKENLPLTSKSLDSDALSSTLINLKSGAKESDVNEIIFNSNITKCPESGDYCEPQYDSGSDDEQIVLLPHKEVPVEPISSRINCRGDDCDISIKALIVCIVVVIFAVPLIYVFYIAEHPEQYDHHHNNT